MSPRVVVDGSTTVAPGAGAAAAVLRGLGNGSNGDQSRKVPADLAIIPTGAKRAEFYKNLERAPEIIPLVEDEDIEEKGLKGRAARFVMEAGQLFVNMQYPAINEMRAQLETEYAAADPEMIRMLSKQHAERTMILRVGRTVVYALAKQLNKEWDQRALDTASSPESLSMAADDFTDALQNVRRDIGRKLRTPRVAVESTPAQPSLRN